MNIFFIIFTFILFVPLAVYGLVVFLVYRDAKKLAQQGVPISPGLWLFIMLTFGGLPIFLYLFLRYSIYKKKAGALSPNEIESNEIKELRAQTLLWLITGGIVVIFIFFISIYAYVPSSRPYIGKISCTVGHVIDSSIKCPKKYPKTVRVEDTRLIEGKIFGNIRNNTDQSVNNIRLRTTYLDNYNRIIGTNDFVSDESMKIDVRPGVLTLFTDTNPNHVIFSRYKVEVIGWSNTP